MYIYIYIYIYNYIYICIYIYIYIHLHMIQIRFLRAKNERCWKPLAQVGSCKLNFNSSPTHRRSILIILSTSASKSDCTQVLKQNMRKQDIIRSPRFSLCHYARDTGNVISSKIICPMGVWPFKHGLRNAGGLAAWTRGCTAVACIKSHGTTMASAMNFQGRQRLGSRALSALSFKAGSCQSQKPFSSTGEASQTESTFSGDRIPFGILEMTSLRSSAGQLRISVLLDRSSCNAKVRIPGVPGVLARMTRSHSLAAASAGKTFTKPSIIQFWIIIGKKFMSPSDSFCAVWGDTSPTRPFSSSEVLSHASKSFMASLWKKSSWAWHVMARSFSMDSGLSTYPKLYGVPTQTLADLRHHNAKKKSWQQQRGTMKSIDGRSSGATSR